MKIRLQKIRGWLHARRIPIVITLGTVAILGIGLIAGADHVCQRTARNKVYLSLEAVPVSDVGLVLGTGKLTKGGNPNWHFSQRIKAAAALYHAGKVRQLLVSGDNHIIGYDEPTDMREALVAAGVPEAAITRDYAGFRTLDSVVRAKIVFGLKRCTIVTEEFHCPRALWIAQRHGLDAVAFAPSELNSLRWGLKVKAREHLARAWCALDLYLLRTAPKFSGPREPIILTANAL